MYFRKILTFCLLFLIGAGVASAKAPNAPSNLRVKPIGVNSFLLEWKDNAKNEKGWEIRVALGNTSKTNRFLLVPVADLTSYVVMTQDLSGKTLSFQVAAYNGETGAEKISEPTSVVTATALDTATFGNPKNLKATPLDDGRIRLTWTDMATTEQGYQIQYRKGSGKWKAFSNTNPDVKFSLSAVGFLPGTEYSFRVRAFKQLPAIFTKFSNVATAKTHSFRAPSSLVATSEGDGAISLKWKDRSSLEAGFEIESKSGTAAFSKLGEVGTNVSSTSPITGFAFDTEFQLRVRAFRIVDGARVYTEYSNVALTKTTGLARPTNLAGQAVDENSIRLTWKDVSTREYGFQVQSRETGTATWNVAGSVGADVKEYTATGLRPGKSYDFQVRASGFFGFFYSIFTPVVQVRTKDGISNDLNPPIFRNTSFTHTVTTSRADQLNSLVIVGTLPAGLTYNPTTRTISGTTTFEGVRTVTLKATFKDGRTVNYPFTLRVIRPSAAPVAGSAFAAVTVAVSNTTSVSTSDKFSDPDTGDARRITTSKGTFDIILYPLATPATVTNFLAYADAGKYDNVFFHRSVADFVVQGGGYKHDGTAFSGVIKAAAVQNEPGISNVAGTVAMAKLPGDPNSATCEFFVSVKDNASILDDQNSGFSVFGRVAGNGLTIVDAINDLPTGDYSVSVNGSSRTLEGVPMDVDTEEAPETMDATKLVKITSVASVPILRYEVTSADEAVATAVINGTNIDITGVATGSTTITVKAFDLDGQMTSQPITVTVP